ncbi:hypothetical protein SHKM778_60830 [Streptomyces sp. KM77-8]|uniref:Uncharacterized protein n=1 Tax=Streptomyces haneummycinicus TaxID=3074435 RepID=A0AAT9HQ75_9ACTN
MGSAMTARTLFRLRACWREQALWGLVNHRATRGSKPTGHANPRLVGAIREALAEQEKLSTRTGSRVLRKPSAGDCRFAANPVAALRGERGRTLESALSPIQS